jgi:hypothetical protein
VASERGNLVDHEKEGAMPRYIGCFFRPMVLIVLLSISTGSATPGQPTCSNATLHGSYGFHATGKDFAAVARFTFDGKGGLTGKLFGRVPGTNIGPLEFTGTYSVSPDCTATDNWLGSTHVSVIVDEGEGYFILNVSEGPDGVNSGEGRRQFKKNEVED